MKKGFLGQKMMGPKMDKMEYKDAPKKKAGDKMPPKKKK